MHSNTRSAISSSVVQDQEADGEARSQGREQHPAPRLLSERGMEDIENSRCGHIAVVLQNMPRLGERSFSQPKSVLQRGHDLGASGMAYERTDVVQQQFLPGEK